MERGRLKCHKYWPDLDEEEHIYGINGELRLGTIKEKNCGEYILRKLELSRKGNNLNKTSFASFLEDNKEPVVRHIYHYQFLGWEDQTSPSGQLLSYMEDINECYENKCPSNSGPIVVHCS